MKNDNERLPDRIVGLQRLEAFFNQKGYLICQSSGEKVYDFDEIVAIFLPLSPSTDHLVAVRSSYAVQYLQKCLLSLQ